MKQIFWIFILILQAFICAAQNPDSIHHEAAYSGTGSINRANEKVAYLLNNSLRYSLRHKHLRLNFANSWVWGQQDGELRNNDYNATLDVNLYPKSPKYYYWGLGNYTTSFSLKIESQVQAGLGAAYNILKGSKGVLNISDGLLYERSNIFLNDTLREDYHTIRNSLRLRFKYFYASLLTVEGNGFIQNSLYDGQDYIIRSNLSLGVKIYKFLSFKAALQYDKIQRTGKENLLFTYGIAIEQIF